jgi:allantoinase
LIIKKAQAALPESDAFTEVDIRIEGETIAEIGSDISFVDDEIIEAEGLVILPGGIDPHVHFDEPGYTSREDFFHGSCAAASGGITTVIDMPDTSVPPVINRRNFVEKLKIIQQKSVVDFGLFGGVSAQSYDQGFPDFMVELSESVLGFKTYFFSGMESFERLNHYQFKRVLEKARELRLPVLLHAEDYDYVTAATAVSRREGSAPLHYYRSRPETAEMLAALSALELVRETGGDLHIVHIGTAAVGELLKESRATGETGPHYLEFDCEDFQKTGAVLKCTPPLKGPYNKERLWKLLAEGWIDFVASDHAPCGEAEKNTGSIWSDYAGIPGCPTLLPFVFSEGYMKGRIGVKRLTETTSASAARRYGIYHRKGSIEKGKDADLVLIDPRETTVVRGKDFYSKGKITPFEGKRLKGKIVKTLRRGRVVYSQERGITAQPGDGRLVTRKI